MHGWCPSSAGESAQNVGLGRSPDLEGIDCVGRLICSRHFPRKNDLVRGEMSNVVRYSGVTNLQRKMMIPTNTDRAKIRQIERTSTRAQWARLSPLPPARCETTSPAPARKNPDGRRTDSRKSSRRVDPKTSLRRARVYPVLRASLRVDYKR